VIQYYISASNKLNEPQKSVVNLKGAIRDLFSDSEMKAR